MNLSTINRLLYSPGMSLETLLLVLGVAYLLGAFHALGPGHGKALMAAYLVGTRGRVRDAVTVAAAITFSHIFSVVLIGLLAMLVMDFFFPETAGIWLSLLSGLGILAIGIWLFVKHWRRRRHRAGGVTEGLSRDHPDTHRLRESHSHKEDHHHRVPHSHQKPPTFWENVMLGISGGLTPCPKAVVIMLLAISLHRMVLGLLVISAFSLGLATTLFGIGVLLVKASHWATHHLPETPLEWLPLVGAGIIIGLGGYVVYLTLATGKILG
ncbi:MAG: hypothetical protein GXO78_11865 [Calditrichaeota bacterium]|nr:hypothetical protein [Calditrichota bacterium]